MNTINIKYLFLVPARKGSKGIPKKNTKSLNGLPLICHTFEYISKILTNEDEVCVSTDDNTVIDLLKPYDFTVIKRPKELSQDNTSMDDVINHVLDNYKAKNISFKAIIILQPTSPSRTTDDFVKLKSLYNSKIDMVVTVRKARENPYYLLYEEDENGFISKSKQSKVTRRQDSPEVYCLNGSFFMINPNSIRKSKMVNFKRIIKLEMPYERSIDIDDKIDWKLTELFFNERE